MYLNPPFPDTRDFTGEVLPSFDGTMRDSQGQIVVFLVSPEYLLATYSHLLKGRES